MLRLKYDVLAALRAEGYTSYSLMRELAINSRISRQLSERRAPGMKTLAKICGVLNAQPGDLLEWIPDGVTIPEVMPWAELQKALPLYVNIVPGEICFKEDILAAIQRLGYSAGKAQELGILNCSTRNDIKKGKMIGPVQLDRLCNCLHCQPGDLIEYVPEDYPS